MFGVGKLRKFVDGCAVFIWFFGHFWIVWCKHQSQNHQITNHQSPNPNTNFANQNLQNLCFGELKLIIEGALKNYLKKPIGENFMKIVIKSFFSS